MRESMEAAENVDVRNCTFTFSTGVRWASANATGVPFIVFCAMAVEAIAFWSTVGKLAIDTLGIIGMLELQALKVELPGSWLPGWRWWLLLIARPFHSHDASLGKASL